MWTTTRETRKCVRPDDIRVAEDRDECGHHLSREAIYGPLHLLSARPRCASRFVLAGPVCRNFPYRRAECKTPHCQIASLRAITLSLPHPLRAVVCRLGAPTGPRSAKQVSPTARSPRHRPKSACDMPASRIKSPRIPSRKVRSISLAESGMSLRPFVIQTSPRARAPSLFNGAATTLAQLTAAQQPQPERARSASNSLEQPRRHRSAAPPRMLERRVKSAAVHAGRASATATATLSPSSRISSEVGEASCESKTTTKAKGLKPQSSERQSRSDLAASPLLKTDGGNVQMTALTEYELDEIWAAAIDELGMVNCVLHCMVHCTVHCMVHCMLHWMVPFMVYCMVGLYVALLLHCTLSSGQKRSMMKRGCYSTIMATRHSRPARWRRCDRLARRRR